MAKYINELISVVTYNLHGFNQGVEYLSELCSKGNIDIIFVQETWLTPSGMTKLESLNVNYLVYGRSAMETAVSCGFLRGRPYGGVATLVRKELGQDITSVLIEDRCVILSLHSFTFINVYMPNDDHSLENLNISIDILSFVSNYLHDAPSQYLCLGGDFNLNLKSTTKQALLLKDFLKTYELFNIESCSNYSDNSSVNVEDIAYTYRNEVLGCYTKIDYICISNSLKNTIINYNIIDSAINHSDHVPVILTMDLHLCGILFKYAKTDVNKTVQNPPSSSKSKAYRNLRWDHGDKDGYYYFTGAHLYFIHNELLLYKETLPESSESDTHIAFVNKCYRGIINVLNAAANQFIPTSVSSAYKPWWGEELKKLKTKSIHSFEIWQNAGKPKDGPIFQMKCLDKLNYKREIRNAKRQGEACISDSLHDLLLNKNPVNFWKTWNNKVTKKIFKKIEIQGGGTDTEIAENFASNFAAACTPNSQSFNITAKDDFNANFVNYTGDYVINMNCVSAEQVCLAVCNLNTGKAPGHDGIVLEHILNSHPIIYTICANLSTIMLNCCCVPSDFGVGIMIPIPKSDKTTGIHQIENFRGITLSPIFSKIFEHCLLFKLNKYISTQDTQFGFKAKTSCSHATYVMRQVVDYYVSNDSTVNV